MALFGFGKKKEAAMPMPPKTASPPQIKIEMPKLSERHFDNLETAEGPLFPEMPKLDLPELEPAEKEMPKEEAPFNLPEIEEMEIPKEIPDEIPEMETPGFAPMAKKSPLFINVDTYSEMTDQLNTTRAKLNEYASAAARVMEIRMRKDSLMEKWRTSLEDAERKLLAVDKILFEGG